MYPRMIALAETKTSISRRGIKLINFDEIDKLGSPTTSPSDPSRVKIHAAELPLGSIIRRRLNA